MTKDETLAALLAERYGTPVREWKPKHRPAPIAEMLDLLRDGTELEGLAVVREAS